MLKVLLNTAFSLS